MVEAVNTSLYQVLAADGRRHMKHIQIFQASEIL
jgi:hypothetical protein